MSDYKAVFKLELITAIKVTRTAEDSEADCLLVDSFSQFWSLTVGTAHFLTQTQPCADKHDVRVCSCSSGRVRGGQRRYHGDTARCSGTRGHPATAPTLCYPSQVEDVLVDAVVVSTFDTCITQAASGRHRHVRLTARRSRPAVDTQRRFTTHSGSIIIYYRRYRQCYLSQNLPVL